MRIEDVEKVVEIKSTIDDCEGVINRLEDSKRVFSLMKKGEFSIKDRKRFVENFLEANTDIYGMVIDSFLDSIDKLIDRRKETIHGLIDELEKI